MNLVRTFKETVSNFWQPTKPPRVYEPEVGPEKEDLLKKLEKRLLKRKAETLVEKEKGSKRHDTGQRGGNDQGGPSVGEEEGFEAGNGAGCVELGLSTQGVCGEQKKEGVVMMKGSVDAVAGMKANARLSDASPLSFDERTRRFNEELAEILPSKPHCEDAIDCRQLTFHPDAQLPVFLQKGLEQKRLGKHPGNDKIGVNEENYSLQRHKEEFSGDETPVWGGNPPKKFAAVRLNGSKQQKFEKRSVAKIDEVGSIHTNKLLKRTLSQRKDLAVSENRSIAHLKRSRLNAQGQGAGAVHGNGSFSPKSTENGATAMGFAHAPKVPSSRAFRQPLKPFDPDVVTVPDMRDLLSRLEKRSLKSKASNSTEDGKEKNRYDTGARHGDKPCAPQWDEECGTVVGGGCKAMFPGRQRDCGEQKREEEMSRGNSDTGKRAEGFQAKTSLNDGWQPCIEERTRRLNKGLAKFLQGEPNCDDIADHRESNLNLDAQSPRTAQKTPKEKTLGKRHLKSKTFVPRKCRQMERLNLEGHNAGRFQQRKFVVRSPTRNEAKSSRKNWTEKAQEFGSIRPPKESKYQKGKENGCTELFDRVFYGRKFEMPELDLGSPTLGEASKRLPTLSWSCSEDEYEPPKPDPPPVDVQPVQQVDSKKIDPVENPHNVPLPVTSDDQSKKSQPKQQSEIVAPTFGDARNLAGLASDSFQFSGKLTPQPSVANKAANPPMVFGAAAASGSQDTQQNTGPSISFNGMFSPAVQGRAIPEGRKIARVKRNRTKVQSQGGPPPGQINGFGGGIPGAQSGPDCGSFSFGSNGNGAAAAAGGPFSNQKVVFSVPGAPAGSGFGLPPNSNGSGISPVSNGFGNPHPSASMGGQFTGFGGQNHPAQTFAFGNGANPFNGGNMQSVPGSAFGFGGGSSTINSGNSSGVFAVGTKGNKRPQTAQARARRRRKQENC